MESRSAYDLIYIGLLIRFLSNVKATDKAERAIAQLKALNEYLKSANLKTSISGFDNFVCPTITKLKAKTSKSKIGEVLRKEINLNILTIEKIVFSETVITKVYVIPERRFNGEYLASKPMNLLKPGVFEKLTDMAVFDFSSACKCLLYGEATASAFHILRSTEEILKQYYFKYKKTKRLDKPMWGPMTSQLRSKRGKRPSDTILNTLDLVRNSYRNPTQHPEVKYDIEEAQDLLGVCIDLINKMGSELDSKSLTGASPPMLI